MHPAQALAVSLIMPWRACQRAWRETKAVPSLLYHVAGLALFFIGMAIVDSVLWYGDITGEFDNIGPNEVPIFFLVIAIWAIMLEMGYFFTAWWTSCWGASVEPMRESFGRSLSRWYQLTPFHAVWTLGMVVSIEIIENMRWDYWDYDYDSVMYQLYDFIYSAMILSIFIVYCGVGGWFTLRALSVPRNNALDKPKCRWPAVCETCGYTIVGLDYQHTCPECGRTVQSSLNTPRGTAPHNTLAKMRLALFNPGALGDILLTRTRTTGPAKALAITALSLLLTGPVGLIYIFIITQVIDGGMWMDSPFEFLQFFMIGGLATGLSAMVGGVSIVLGVGSLIGLSDRVFGKRNNLPAACHAACYASGYIVFMALLMYGFTGALILFSERYLDHMGFGLIAILPLVWMTTAALLTLPMLFIVGRIVRNTKYANA